MSVKLRTSSAERSKRNIRATCKAAWARQEQRQGRSAGVKDGTRRQGVLRAGDAELRRETGPSAHRAPNQNRRRGSFFT